MIFIFFIIYLNRLEPQRKRHKSHKYSVNKEHQEELGRQQESRQHEHEVTVMQLGQTWQLKVKQEDGSTIAGGMDPSG